MSIIRAPRPEINYYILDKRIAEDPTLSWAARGLLIYLLVKPDNWTVSVSALKKQTEAARVSTGRDGVYALLKELIAAGYVSCGPRKRNPDGTLGESDYIISETPAIPDQATPDVDQPNPAKPDQAQPDQAGTTLISNQYYQVPTTTKPKARERAQRLDASASTVDVPAWIPGEAWSRFVDHRKSIKKPLTADAARLAINALDKLRAAGNPPAQVIDQSIFNGWAGVFSLRDTGAGNYGNAGFSGSRRESDAERIERINRQHDERERAEFRAVISKNER